MQLFFCIAWFIRVRYFTFILIALEIPSYKNTYCYVNTSNRLIMTYTLHRLSKSILLAVYYSFHWDYLSDHISCQFISNILLKTYQCTNVYYLKWISTSDIINKSCFSIFELSVYILIYSDTQFLNNFYIMLLSLDYRQI